MPLVNGPYSFLIQQYLRNPTKLNRQLLIASNLGLDTYVQDLIAEGADINARGVADFTPLIRAAENNQLTVVSLLIQSGAKLNLSNRKGNTALMLAAQNGHTAIVSVLIAAGANIELKNNQRETAFMLAENNHQQEVVFRFLSEKKYTAIVSLEEDPFAHAFVSQCKKAMFAIQREILTVFWVFRHIPNLSDPIGPVNFVISHLCPHWYKHRAENDSKLIRQKLDKILENRSKITKSSGDIIAAAVPALTFLASSSEKITDPLPLSIKKRKGENQGLRKRNKPN